MNLLLNLLGLRVYLSYHLVNSRDDLGKTAIMTLHLIEVDLFFKSEKKKKKKKRSMRRNRTLFTKVEMVTLKAWEILIRRSTSCPLWDSMAHWGQTAVWSVLQYELTSW